MNNNTNHNFTDLFEQSRHSPTHSSCKICAGFSMDSFEYCDDDNDDAYMTICEDCFNEILDFETKFAKVLGTVKY